MSQLEKIVLIFSLIIIVFILVSFFEVIERRKDCRNRGYAYIQGQCVELRLK
jgi:hypothetical protein